MRTLDLAVGEMLRLQSPRRVELACDRGRVWVTEESESRDVWLEAGESVVLEAKGLAVVEATRAARIRIGC